MDILVLRYVVTLSEELHFGRAAKRHFVSAQPFGQRVQRLERELGVCLFERTSRRVSLTVAGARFVAQARATLAQVDRLREVAAEDGAADAGRLRVGVLGFGAADHWRDLRHLLEVQQPGLSLEFRDLDLVDQYDAVRLADVDVAVVQYVGDLDGLEFETVFSSPRVAVVPASSAMADASALTFGDLSDRRWLRVASREPLMRAWEGSPRARTAAPVRHPAAIPAAVATTGGVSLHAAVAARYYPRPDVRFVPLEGPPVQIAVATRREDRRPAVTAFRRAAAAARSMPSAGTGDRNDFA
jgi:DNA-binding transcriptional LysR family regulator